MRIEDGAAGRTRNGGWLHRLQGDAAIHRREPRTFVAAFSLPSRLDDLAERMARELGDDRCARWAEHLGVRPEALRALQAGLTMQYGRVWLSFPMHGPAGGVCGIRLRAWNGKKLAQRGGREGLFVPSARDEHGPLLVTEGPTDCAAALSTGFDALGRPSCTGGTRACAVLARGRDVVVVADGDAPGRRGAESLATTLLSVARSVRVVLPPAEHKDLRAWVRAGAARGDVDQLIAAAPIRRLQLREARA